MSTYLQNTCMVSFSNHTPVIIGTYEVCKRLLFIISLFYLKQKHQRCKKVQGQSEVAIIDQKV